MQKSPIQLNSEFNEILDVIEKDRENVFVTGRAGTGKSTLLGLLRRTTRRNAAVVAPTGIAALNVGGQTIHSFFKLPPKMIALNDIKKRRNHRFYKKIELLIIDEISMVRVDMIDVIDTFLRVNREDPRPFGGVQVVFFGDLFQLPPVISSAFEKQVLVQHYTSRYFFSAHVFQSGFPMRMIELQKVFRQEERRFIRLLDNIRLNQFDYDDLEELNQQVGQQDWESDGDLSITLCSINATADRINKSELDKINAPLHEYSARVTGEFNERFCTADTHLWLKEGAQVMFLKNDTEGQYVNGTLGTIVSLEDEIIARVRIKGEYRHIAVERSEWEMLKYEIDPGNPEKFKTKVVGTFEQYPVKLAWAITIHKSQGKTFDRVKIDLGKGAFDFGQTYVALSRCRTLEGISLIRKLEPRDVIVDPRIVEYYEDLKRR